MDPLPEGNYDAIVVGVEDDAGADGSVGVDVAITGGPMAGRVVSLRRVGPIDGPPTGDPLSLLGLTGTLRVDADGVRFRPERA